MANKNILIKRNNGGVIDVLYPQTIITNLYDTDGTTALFDGSKKLKSDYLPGFVFGGMRFAGAITATGNASTLYSSALSYVSSNGGSVNGIYFISSGTFTITGGVDSTNGVSHSFAYGPTTAPAGEEEDANFSDGLTLENGDWLVIIRTWEYMGTNYVQWGVVNNTYADATGTVKGVVTLSTATTTTSMNGSSKVITEDVLFDSIGTTSGKIAAGDHLHSGVYQPVDGDLTALAALSGTGFVKRTGADTYTLDTNTYLTSQSQDFGTVTVTDTDSGHTWGTTGSAVADANADTLTIVDGDGVDIDASPTTDAIRISHTDTSTLSGAQGSAGIASITVDGFGHVTAVTTATYNNYSLPLAANGTRGGLQIGFTSTETDRALLLSSERGYISLPRQIPAVTLNGASSTSPSFYAPTGAGLTGSTSQTKQLLMAQTGAAPIWQDAPVIYYDTTTGTTHGDIIFDEI